MLKKGLFRKITGTILVCMLAGTLFLGGCKNSTTETNNTTSGFETKNSEQKTTENGTTKQTENTTQETKEVSEGYHSISTGNLTEKGNGYEGTKGTGKYNYGEALQKAVLFYELQRSGKLPDETRCNWRGDSALTDGADKGVDLTGGLYDAGDNVKFNLPMAYTATLLAWSVYENKAAYEESGQYKYILDNIKWIDDYLIKCHTKDHEFYYQVGDGNIDHGWWGPCEVMQMERPSYCVTDANPGSCVVGESAAALAAASIIFQDTDKDYAAKCLEHAKSLFEFADSTKSDAGYTAANGFYTSFGGFYDELMWSAVWLYLSTNDEKYLKKAEEYWNPEADYKWTHCWDDSSFGATLLLARITGEAKYKEWMEKNLDFWTTGTGSERITYTPKGLAWLDTWGSLRYASTEAFLAYIYSESKVCPAEKKPIYHDFAVAQINYALGDGGRSYEVGFGENSPKNPHHRTAQGSYCNNMNEPAEARHTLYGALVGGPDANDGYEDTVTDYTKNEVACDYNAGFVAALSCMYKEFKGETLKDFGAVEEPKSQEMYVSAAVNVSGQDFVEIKAFVTNESGWPARVMTNPELRYYVDISEIIAAGGSAEDVVVSTNYSQGANANGLVCQNEEENIYYVPVSFAGEPIYPGGQSMYKKEVQFRMRCTKGVWDNSNDPSFSELKDNNGSTNVICTHMALFDNGKLVFGEEPVKGANAGGGGGIKGRKVATKASNDATTATTAGKISASGDGLMLTIKPAQAGTSTGAINLGLTLANTGSAEIDLSKVAIYYFFTNDGDQSLQAFCDSSAITGNVAPYYRTTQGSFEFKNESGKDYDRICVIKAAGKDKLSAGEKWELGARIAKSDWSSFNTSNDYSAGGADKIVVTYDGKDVLGTRP